ncbi:MAG TPA: phosphate signaling complex protein PhoU [Verrucomicrobiae bacterium]|jgi:phosphate transport system protein|nr:phosphate signaling complex protein PhoU [Verrucomicrobiae bacterium]
MQTYFDDELAKFKEKLLTMGSYAESAVSQAVQSVVERDDNLASQVQQNDDLMDQLEVEIDDMAVNLLAKAPLGSDLRLITVAMKISQNLERVGDEATTISRRAMELNQEPQLKSFIDIPRMAGIALGMLKEALDTFVRKEPEKARAIVPRDKEVDAINRQMHRELSNCMVEDPATIGRCLNLMTVSKSLERVGDHAANIAEEVVYLCEARDIRHEINRV